MALIQIMTTGEVGVRRHRRAVATSALLCATLVGVLGAMAAGVALVGRSVPALEGATNWILRVLGNPLFWLALIVISVGIYLGRGSERFSRSVTEPPPPTRDRPPDRYPADGGVNGRISG